MNRIIVCVLLSLFGSAMLSAQVKLLPIISDNMVLQQRVKAPIWGETLPNKTVEIITSWNKKKYTALADEKGKCGGVRSESHRYGLALLVWR